MKVFFDNCTPPVYASTLDGYIRHSGHQAFHIRDLPCGRSAPDVEWMKMLADDHTEWVVITGDDRIRRNKAEQLAFRSARLRGFVLASAYQKTPINQVCGRLIWRWPEIEQLVNLVAPPAMWELPLTGKIRQLI